MTRIPFPHVVLAVMLVVSVGFIGAGMRFEGQYVRVKNSAAKPAARGTISADVRRAELLMNGCFISGGVGLVGCMIGALTMKIFPRPVDGRRGFDVQVTHQNTQ